MDEDIAIAIIKQWGTKAYDGPGWYYYDAEYPEEGSAGSFRTKEEAIVHAKSCGYEVNDE